MEMGKPNLTETSKKLQKEQNAEDFSSYVTYFNPSLDFLYNYTGEKLNVRCLVTQSEFNMAIRKLASNVTTYCYPFKILFYPIAVTNRVDLNSLPRSI